MQILLSVTSLYAIFYPIIPIILSIQYPSPSTQELKIPYRITGPAMVNILHPTPKTCPSFLNSMAGAATELAKPVMGTREPAPAHFVMLG